MRGEGIEWEPPAGSTIFQQPLRFDSNRKMRGEGIEPSQALSHRISHPLFYSEDLKFGIPGIF